MTPVADVARVKPDRGAAARAGGLAGIAGLAAFLLLHHLWIVPIWFIAPIGGLLAAAGGAAVGVAYGELHPYLPPRPWTAVAAAIAFGVVLAPGVVVAELRGPVFELRPDGGARLLVPGADAIADVVVGLLGTATLTGAALGWLVARTTPAAGSMALAGFMLALGPGHNIPLLGGSPAVGKELAILSVVLGVATAALVAAYPRLARCQSFAGARETRRSARTPLGAVAGPGHDLERPRDQ